MQLAARWLLVALGCSTRAFAQEASDVEALVHVYADDDRVTVVSPSVWATLPLGPHWKGSVDSHVDVVSAASVDVVTSASPAPVSDLRVEFGGGAEWAPSSTRRVGARVVGSHENDYDSARLTVQGSVELFERNLTLDLAWTGFVDRVGKASDKAFTAGRAGQRLALSAGQLLGPRTVADVVVDVGLGYGYHANPYRSVVVVDALSALLLRLDEATPAQRLEGAALVRLRQALDAEGRIALSLSYRACVDDWGLVSHTGAARLVASVGERSLWALQLRAYRQGAARFYRPRYELDAAGVAPVLRTADRNLSAMSTLSASLTGDVRFGPGLHALATTGGMLFRYDDFPAQRQRLAVTVGLGLGADL